MNSDLIPADDSGEYTITGSQLVTASIETLRELERQLMHEARARNLEVTVSDSFLTNGVVIKWRQL